jgi:hypothetical protein
MLLGLKQAPRHYWCRRRLNMVALLIILGILIVLLGISLSAGLIIR